MTHLVLAFFVLFQFICSDPPLSEEDIPSGLWLCHLCRMLKLRKQQNESQIDENIRCSTESKMNSKDNTRPNTPISIKSQINENGNCSRKSSFNDFNVDFADKEIKTELISITNGTKVDDFSENNDQIEITNGDALNSGNSETQPIDTDASVATENVSNDIKCVEMNVENSIENVEKLKNENNDENEIASCVRSSLDELVKAASLLNPKQFELPREMTIYPRFPGDDKGDDEFLPKTLN